MVTPMPGGRRRIDRVLDPDYLGGISDMSMDVLRERRQDAMMEEADLSYVRRMLQGRIEILENDVDARPDESDDELVARLTSVLVGNTTSVSSSRHLVAEPTRISERRRYVERLIADVSLSDTGGMTPDQADAALVRLKETERTVSRTRGQVHQVIDQLTDELGRRYRAGQVDSTV